MRKNLQLGLVDVLLDALGLVVSPAIGSFAGLDDGVGLGVVALVFDERQYHSQQRNGDGHLFTERIVRFRYFWGFRHGRGRF